MFTAYSCIYKRAMRRIISYDILYISLNAAAAAKESALSQTNYIEIDGQSQLIAAETTSQGSRVNTDKAATRSFQYRYSNTVQHKTHTATRILPLQLHVYIYD